MSTDLSDLKETLDGVADRVHARPPLREDIDRSLRRVTRRRRAARVAQTAGVLVTVAGLLGAVQATGMPLPSWAPAVKVGQSAASALAGQPTRGSLAGDAVWLRGLREKVATFDRSEGGGERWRAPSADAVDVLFAGDVGAYRVAVVETPLRWGAIEARQQIAYLGLAGAAPSAMEDGLNQEPADVFYVDASNYQVQDGRGAAVLLGPAWLDVQQVGAPSVRADGSVRLETTPLLAVSPGTWQVEVPRGERTWLTWGGGEHVVAVGDTGPVSVETPGPERTALLDGVRPAQRNSSVAPDVASDVPADDRLAASVAAAQYATGLPLAGTSRRLVWSGTLGGLPTDVVDVVAPSGGHAVVAVQGNAMTAGQMTASDVRAAAKGAPASLAWSYQAMQQVSSDSWRAGGPFMLGLVGPASAVRAVVSTETGSVDVDIADGVGWVQADRATSVQFFDEAGSTVGTAKVRAPDAAVTLGPVVTG